MLTKDDYFERRAQLLEKSRSIIELEKRMMDFLVETVHQSAAQLHQDFSRSRDLCQVGFLIRLNSAGAVPSVIRSLGAKWEKNRSLSTYFALYVNDAQIFRFLVSHLEPMCVLRPRRPSFTLM